MSSLSRDLRRELSPEFPNGNPLVAIGVSAHILDLGLSPDELFAYITKDVARRLVLRFHSDRGGFASSEGVASLRGRLSEAYRQLQDRQVFDKALAEFRDLKAEERTETRILRTALEAVRAKLTSYESKEVAISQGGRQLEREWEDMERKKAVQRRLIPELEGQLARQEQTIRNLHASLAHYRKSHRGLTRYVSFLGSDGDPSIPYPHAFEAKWAAIVSLVPAERASYTHERPKAIGEDGKWTKSFRAAVGHLEIAPKDLVLIHRRWLKAQRILGKPLEHEPRWTYGLRLSVLSLAVGKPTVLIGWPMVKGRVIGSVPQERLSPFSRKDLIYKMPGDTVAERLIPFLVPGGLLVSEMLKKTITEPSGRRFPVMVRDTKHLILAVG